MGFGGVLPNRAAGVATSADPKRTHEINGRLLFSIVYRTSVPITIRAQDTHFFAFKMAGATVCIATLCWSPRASGWGIKSSRLSVTSAL